jgi:hypothetical protein
MMTRRPGSRGSMPAGAIVLVALALTAVIGLIAGAVWGQIGRGGSSASPSTEPTAVVSSTAAASSPPAPSDTATSTSDTGSPSPSATDASPTDSGSPAVTPTGSVPPAPATTTTSADGWRLGSWKVTNTSGTLGIDTTARNTATGTRSATLVLYVYVNGVHIATTTAVVTDVAAGATVPVHFAGTDPWQAGPKVLLLATG